MTTIRLHKKTIGASDAARLVLSPQKILTPPETPKEILQENQMIHHMLGAENVEETWFTLANGWTIRGIPDIWRDDRMIEIKVVRPGSDRNALLAHAAYQAMIYALAEKIETVEVWLYNYASGEVQSYTFNVDDLQPARFFNTLEANLNMFTRLQTFVPQLSVTNENKLSMRALKVRE